MSSSSHGTVSAATTAGRGAGLTRARSALLLIALGVATLAAAGPAWVRAQTATALDPAVDVAVTGGSAAPAVDAAGFVIIAAGLALALVGPAARWVVLAAAAGAGSLVSFSAVSVALRPDGVAAAGAGEVAGVTDLTGPVTVTAWPWVCAAVGLLVLGAAATVAVLARRWPTSSSRHERADAPSVPSPSRTAVQSAGHDAPVDSHEAWDALTRGADPTATTDR